VVDVPLTITGVRALASKVELVVSDNALQWHETQSSSNLNPRSVKYKRARPKANSYQ